MTTISRLFIGPGAGYATRVEEGRIFTFEAMETSQVIDLNLFVVDQLAETFSSSATRVREGTHLTKGNLLYSRPPWERPIAEIVEDTIGERGKPVDITLPQTHDLLFGRCSSALRELLYGAPSPGCQEILTDAIVPFGLGAEDVHDPLNIFMNTHVDAQGRPEFVDPVSRFGDKFSIKVLTACIVAFSCCPGASSGPNPGGISFSVQ